MTSTHPYPTLENMDTTIHTETTPLKQDLDRLNVMKQEARAAKKAWEALQEKHDAYEQQLYDRMDDEDTWTLKSSKAQYVGKSTTYATINDMDALRDWLTEQELFDEFIKDAPEKARLNELVREYLDNGQTLPPGVGSYDRRYIAITNLNKD